MNRKTKNSLVVKTNSADETKDLGEKIGRSLKAGDIVALCGELGSGKTVMVAGMAKGLQIVSSIPVTSPTFILLHEYEGKTPLYHFDFYRLSKADEIYNLGFEEYFEGDGVCAVEWADKFEGVFDGPVLWVNFSGAGDSNRIIEIRPDNKMSGRWAEIKDVLGNRDIKVTAMKKVVMKKYEVPLLPNLTKKQKALWNTSMTVVATYYYENEQASSISNLLLKLLNDFDSSGCSFLIRYISTTKSIIDKLEKVVTTLGLESYRYPIKIGYECLMAKSKDLKLLHSLVEWWDSADDFDIFLLPDQIIGSALKSFKSDGYKNRNNTYYDVAKLSKIVFRKSIDKEVLEIISCNYTYDKIRQNVAKEARELYE